MPPPHQPKGGHRGMPHPPSSQRGENQGQETGGGRGARREPILRLPTISTQECTKPGRMPEQMPWSGKGFVESRDTLPLPKDSLLRGGPQVSPIPRCLSRSPGRGSGGLRRRVGASSPPPRGAPPPAGGGAFVPHVEPAGPAGTAHHLPTHRAAATWGPGRKRPQPSSTWKGAGDPRSGVLPQAPES